MPFAGVAQTEPSAAPEASSPPDQAEAVKPAPLMTFEEALTSAYKTNPRIKAQRKTAEQAHERVSQSIGAFRPTVNTTYANGRQRNGFNGNDFQYGDVENRELIISQPIFQGGRNIYRYFGAKSRMESSHANLQNFEQEVLLDAIAAYLDVVQNHSVLELSKNNRTVLSRQLDASKNRFEVGDVTQTDVAQSEARLSRAESEVIQAEADLESALAQFERVIGSRPENLPLPMPVDLPPLPVSLEEAIEKAVESNPSLRASKWDAEAAEDDVGVSRAAILPQVSLDARVSRQDGVGLLGGGNFKNDSILMNVTMPLYQNGSEYSVIRESKLIAKQRSFEYTDRQQAVREAVTQSWENLKAATARIRSQQEVIRAAQVALEGVKQEQQYGARTVLDVLDAEQELFVAQVELVRVQRNRLVSLYELLVVTGELTPSTLKLDAEPYDPTKHYDDVKWQLIGY